MGLFLEGIMYLYVSKYEYIQYFHESLFHKSLFHQASHTNQILLSLLYKWIYLSILLLLLCDVFFVRSNST